MGEVEEEKFTFKDISNQPWFMDMDLEADPVQDTLEWVFEN